MTDISYYDIDFTHLAEYLKEFQELEFNDFALVIRIYGIKLNVLELARLASILQTLGITQSTVNLSGQIVIKIK